MGSWRGRGEGRRTQHHDRRFLLPSQEPKAPTTPPQASSPGTSRPALCHSPLLPCSSNALGSLPGGSAGQDTWLLSWPTALPFSPRLRRCFCRKPSLKERSDPLLSLLRHSLGVPEPPDHSVCVRSALHPCSTKSSLKAGTWVVTRSQPSFGL